MTPIPADDLVKMQNQAREWCRFFQLPFRQHKWRGQAGELSGRGTGSSLEFQDHRAYFPGDDPRQINWQAYARTGNYTMKLYREEVRPMVDLVLDASPSMFAFPKKQQRTLELFLFAVEASMQAGAALRVYLVNESGLRTLEPQALFTGHWWREVETMHSTALASAQTTRETSGSAFVFQQIPWRASTLRVWISDLLFPSEPEPHLQSLVQRQGRGLIFCPYAAAESQPEWDGNYDFEDAETLALHEQRIDGALMQRYSRAYEHHFRLWRDSAARHAATLVRVAADAPFLDALRLEGLANGALEPSC